MSSNLHPSQLHKHLQMYNLAKWASWCSLVVSASLLFLGASQKAESKPWILASSVGTLEVGRRHRQTAKLLQESLGTAENFGLQGDKDTLYSCFVLVRLGQFGRDHARSKLKDPQLEQWLKAGGKKRCMVDDCPCEIDLSNWGIGATASAPVAGDGDQEEQSQPLAMNEYEQFILTWGQQHPGELLKAGILSRASRLFDNMQPDEIRIFFASMADRRLGEIEGSGAKLGWRWIK